ncbi:MAG: hypothetical protein IPP73_01295 [Chitinophagaceae bacterium]|nr:hypothetical protein [Chitinophagaceae bacterium]
MEPLNLTIPPKKDGFYPFYVWSACLVLSPVLLFIWTLITSGSMSDGSSIFVWLLVVVYSAFFSLPALLFYYLAYYFISKWDAPVLYLKTACAVVALTGMVITFIVLEMPVLIYAYAPGIIIPSVWIRWFRKDEFAADRVNGESEQFSS